MTPEREAEVRDFIGRGICGDPEAADAMREVDCLRDELEHGAAALQACHEEMAEMRAEHRDALANALSGAERMVEQRDQAQDAADESSAIARKAIGQRDEAIAARKAAEEEVASYSALDATLQRKLYELGAAETERSQARQDAARYREVLVELRNRLAKAGCPCGQASIVGLMAVRIIRERCPELESE